MRALIAALLLCPAAAIADFYNGNELYDRCQRFPDVAGVYAAGVLDGGRTMEYWNRVSATICVPNGVTIGQAGEVMCNYLVRYPEKRHLSASSLVLNAFEAAWPCSR